MSYVLVFAVGMVAGAAVMYLVVLAVDHRIRTFIDTQDYEDRVNETWDNVMGDVVGEDEEPEPAGQ